jgi:hypothetical protein
MSKKTFVASATVEHGGATALTLGGGGWNSEGATWFPE